MNPLPQLLDPAARASEKDRSRQADSEALAYGRVSSSDLREENEVFGRLGVLVRIDLSAARALA